MPEPTSLTPAEKQSNHMTAIIIALLALLMVSLAVIVVLAVRDRSGYDPANAQRCEELTARATLLVNDNPDNFIDNPELASVASEMDRLHCQDAA